MICEVFPSSIELKTISTKECRQFELVTITCDQSGEVHLYLPSNSEAIEQFADVFAEAARLAREREENGQHDTK